MDEPVSVETVVFTSRNCTAKQLDPRTADCLSHATMFSEDATIDRHYR